MKSELVVSVVSALGDAEGYIDDYLHEVHKILGDRFKDFEIVLVADRPDGAAVARVEALQKEVDNIQLYCLARPLPAERALVVGLEQAIGDVIITLDPAYDPPHRIMDLVAEFKGGADIVYGLRVDRVRPAGNRLYHASARAFYRVFRTVTREDIPIEVSTFRLLSRRAVNAFLDNRDRYWLFPVISSFAGYPHAKMPYDRIKRTGKPRRVNYRQGLSRALRILIFSSHWPFRIVTMGSVLGALANILYSTHVVVVKLTEGDRLQAGWASLSVQISLMFFLMFVVLGILSEYVLRLFMHTQNRPPYIIARENTSVVLSRKQELNVSSEPARTASTGGPRTPSR